MTQIETKYRDPESKNRLKQLKLDAQKQIERNKIILKDLINKYAYNDVDRLQPDRSDVHMNSKIQRSICWEGKLTIIIFLK